MLVVSLSLLNVLSSCLLGVLDCILTLSVVRCGVHPGCCVQAANCIRCDVGCCYRGVVSASLSIRGCLCF